MELLSCAEFLTDILTVVKTQKQSRVIGGVLIVLVLQQMARSDDSSGPLADGQDYFIPCDHVPN